MFKNLFSQKNQMRATIIVGFVVLVAVAIAVAGKTEVVTHEDGTQTIKRSLFGYTIGK